MKLEIINRRKVGEFTNTLKLNYTFLNNWWVKGEITNEIVKYFQISENENITYQNVCDITTA